LASVTSYIQHTACRAFGRLRAASALSCASRMASIPPRKLNRAFCGHILLSASVESVPERCKVPEAADWERRKSSASAKITSGKQSGGVTTRVTSLMGEHRKGAAALLVAQAARSASSEPSSGPGPLAKRGGVGLRVILEPHGIEMHLMCLQRMT
jgi:hypothetical protein